MFNQNPNRRDFLISSGLIGATICSSPLSRLFAGNNHSVTEQIIRKDACDLTDEEVSKYRLAIRRLKERGNGRPRWIGDSLRLPEFPMEKRSYTYQALVHTHNCPHGNWWFLPWHRIYLFYFEQILRELVKDDRPDVPLAIPYWNWTEQREIPDIFEEDPQNNPLYDDRRFSVSLLDEDVGHDRIREVVDGAVDFDAFGGDPSCASRARTGKSQLESVPHDAVHNFVGGWDSSGRTGNMMNPLTSAFDPIFWSHHANIDRLWDVWLSQAGHSNPDVDEPCTQIRPPLTWGSLKYNKFVDGSGHAMDRSVEDFLTDPQLQNVVYQERNGELLVARGENEAMPRKTQPKNREPLKVKAEAATDEPFTLRLRKSVTLSVPSKEEVGEQIKALGRTDQPQGSVLFHVQHIHAMGNPPVRVRAFLNKPDASTETSFEDPHYIGSFTFFGADHQHGDDDEQKGFGILLNLTPALKKLREELDPRKPLTVTFVAVPLAEEFEKFIPQDLVISFESATLIINM